MTKWNFMLIWVEHEKSFITPGSNLHLRLAHMSENAASPHIATYKVLFLSVFVYFTDKLLKTAKIVATLNGRTYILKKKHGGMKQAVEDFWYLKPTQVREFKVPYWFCLNRYAWANSIRLHVDEGVLLYLFYFILFYLLF